MKKICGLILLLAIAPPSHAADEPEALATLFPLRARFPRKARSLPSRTLARDHLRVPAGSGRPPNPRRRRSRDSLHRRQPRTGGRRDRGPVPGPAGGPRRHPIPAHSRRPNHHLSRVLRTPAADPPAGRAGLATRVVGRSGGIRQPDPCDGGGSGGRVRSILRGSAFRLPGAGAEKLRFTVCRTGDGAPQDRDREPEHRVSPTPVHSRSEPRPADGNNLRGRR